MLAPIQMNGILLDCDADSTKLSNSPFEVPFKTQLSINKYEAHHHALAV
jgi:hypothetical protein